MNDYRPYLKKNESYFIYACYIRNDFCDIKEDESKGVYEHHMMARANWVSDFQEEETERLPRMPLCSVRIAVFP